MFGHGGDDWIQAGMTGENLLVGGSGSDKFVIENGAQNTIIIGDHAKVDGGDFDNSKTFIKIQLTQPLVLTRTQNTTLSMKLIPTPYILTLPGHMLIL